MLCAMEEVWGAGFEEGLNPELQYLDHLQVRLAAGQSTLLCMSTHGTCGLCRQQWDSSRFACSRRFAQEAETNKISESSG